MSELPMTMPKMSMTMEEGTMVSWLKSVGDTVRAGEPICEVATDKVDIEVECPFDGVLARIVAEVDEVVPVGETIAIITTDADDLLGGLFDEPGDPQNAVADSGPVPLHHTVEPAAAQHGEPTTTRAVPLARSLAADLGIDLRTVTPTGQWHTIRVSDVEAATHSVATIARPPVVFEAAAPAPAPASAPSTHVVSPLAAPAETHHVAPTAADPVAAKRLRGRQQLARLMSASALVPQFTAFADLDVRATDAVRKTELAGASWTALLIRAQALALAEVPALNATWTETGSRANPQIGVAVAVDSPTGLIAPVLLDPAGLELAELVSRVRDAVTSAREGTLGLDRLSGGTTVFSSLGSLGVDSFTALLTPPQSTAMSVGAVANKVFATDDGAIAVGLRCTIGLTVDHRVADGADAARFLSVMREIFLHPERLR
jgi:pyruvate dehydrogenase E2 component (dihydrolipoamide acetyltransferase)